MKSPLASEILETVPVLMRVIRGEMRRHGLPSHSMAEFRALIFVGRHQGTDLSAMADHLGLSMPSASRIVESLIQDRLMERTSLPRDRRRLSLTLTPAGWTEMQRARAAAGRHLGERVGGLDPAAQNEMVKTLRRLRKVFSDHAPISHKALPAKEPLLP